jgi:L-ribulose-5-phosphate 4-epimerase
VTGSQHLYGSKTLEQVAVMIEEIARTVWLALQIGQPDEIPDEDVAKLHHRYTHIYGQ